SPAQRKVIWRRDGHCTYPGCTIPAQWTDVHHVTWWARSGPTDIANGALLCGRHHTLVHDRDLTADIDTTGVTWHL
ncbi:HNH endonuclease signature motif containing protein, partial [Lapillicoccus sp.]|uniref:HNH endonuclease signature motif containing protein n=1 Tax=Lapillicoccus sp. TaxID=1909287 RepID=UPI0025F4A82F